ncbi:MAG: Ig-like domain-containing protein [Pseudomonadota bacterium]
MFVFRNKMRVVSTTLLVSSVLSACGGGGSTPATPVPSAQPDVAAASLNTSSNIAVLANDSVTNGGTLKLVSVTTPAHGSATISGDKIVYTPASGFFGKDNFSYTAKDSGSGTATATADVAVTVNANLTLSGRTFDLPGNATLSVVIGATTIAASTDANGNFSVPVALDTPASMVSITAQGRDANAFIKLISLVGDSQTVVNAAGAATVVTPATLPGLAVSGMSTSVYGNLRYRNGQTPATQAMLDDASGRISGSEMLQMAAVLRSLTGNALTSTAAWRTLPAGVGDTLSLVSNFAVYSQYVKTLYQSGVVEDMVALQNDANIGTVPAVTTTTSKSLVFFNNGGCCAIPAMELVFNPNASGSFYRDQKRTAGTWHKDSALTLDLAVPEVHNEFITLPDTSVAEVEITTNSVSMRQLSGKAGQGFAMLTYNGSIHYINGELPDGPYSSGAVVPFADWDSLGVPADLSGAVLAGVPDVAIPAIGYAPQVIMTLASGGSATSPQLPGATIGWQLQNGKLVLNFASPHTLTMARTRINTNGEERWLVRAANGADYTMYETMIVRPQPNLAFTAANVVQRWFSSPTTSFVGTRAFVNVFANNTSGTENVQVNGTITSAIATTWLIDNGKLAMHNASSDNVWTLLRDDGNTIVVLEKYNTTRNSRQRVLRYSHD